MNWTLTIQTCCLEPVLNTRAQACPEAFWSPRESHSMTMVLGQKFTLPSLCRWKGRSLNCPETRWKEVEDSQQSRRVTTSRARLARRVWRRLRRSGRRRVDDNPTGVRAGSLLRLERSPAGRRCWSGTAPACNRLSESISLLFCSL